MGGSRARQPRSRSRRSAPAADGRLRHVRAVDEALRLLDCRDLPRAELERRLRRGGVGAGEAAEAASALARTGVVDDRRYAGRRARGLAERGWGDEGIRFKLEQEELPERAVAEALAALEPEAERALALLTRRGVSRRTLAYLAGRGFGAEAVEAAASVQLAE